MSAEDIVTSSIHAQFIAVNAPSFVSATILLTIVGISGTLIVRYLCQRWSQMKYSIIGLEFAELTVTSSVLKMSFQASPFSSITEGYVIIPKWLFLVIIASIVGGSIGGTIIVQVLARYRSQHTYMILSIEGSKECIMVRRFWKPKFNSETQEYDLYCEQQPDDPSKKQKGKFYHITTSIDPKEIDKPPYCVYTWKTKFQRFFWTRFYFLTIWHIELPVETNVRSKPPLTLTDWFYRVVAAASIPIFVGIAVIVYWIVDAYLHKKVNRGFIEWRCDEPNYPQVEVQALQVAWCHTKRAEPEEESTSEEKGPIYSNLVDLVEWYYLRNLEKRKLIEIKWVMALKDDGSPFTKTVDFKTILHVKATPYKLRHLMMRLMAAEYKVEMFEAQMDDYQRDLARSGINSVRKTADLTEFIVNSVKALEIHVMDIWSKSFGIDSQAVFEERFAHLLLPKKDPRRKMAESLMGHVRSLNDILMELMNKDGDESGQKRSLRDRLRFWRRSEEVAGEDEELFEEVGEWE